MLWCTIMFYSKEHFTLAFYLQSLFFSAKICTFEFMLYRGKPTMNWFFPRWSMWQIDQIKDWFQLRTSIRHWTREWIKTEIMQNGFEIYTKKGRVSKTGRILSKNRTFPAKTGGLESLLEYAFKLIFLKCIFEFIIKTAPTTSNSFHSREKCFKYNNYFNVTEILSHI